MTVTGLERTTEGGTGGFLGLVCKAFGLDDPVTPLPWGLSSKLIWMNGTSAPKEEGSPPRSADALNVHTTCDMCINQIKKAVS